MTTAATRTRLAHDERGAILVMGIVMCVFLVGILYYLQGIGTTLFFRERMQDAADAVSLGTAIGHARGMNLIVFINLVMAALVAVLLALKVIEMMLVALMVILAAISWFFPPAAAAIPTIKTIRDGVHEVHDAAQKIVDPLLKALHITERVIASIMPALAVGKTAFDIEENYSDVVAQPAPVGVIGLPTRLTLPVEDDTYDVLCDRAAGILEGLVQDVTGGIPFVGKVIDVVLGTLIKAVSQYFCKGSTEPPDLGIDFDRVLPFSPTGQACEDAQIHMSSDLDACTAWQKEQFDRRPDPFTGECTNAECEQNLKNARAVCDPRNRELKNFTYREANVTETLEFTAEGWTTKEYEYASTGPIVNYPEFEEYPEGTPREQIPDGKEPARTRPCDPQQMFGRAFNDGWSPPNPQVRDVGASPTDPKQVIPYCHRYREEPPALPAPEVGTTKKITYRAVQHVYGCSKPEHANLVIPGDWESLTEGGTDKAPQKMEKDVKLGDENFQIRGFVILGKEPPKKAEEGLKVAAWHQTVAPEGWVGIARKLGQFSAAQAEYFYNHDGTEDIAEWMWNMHWKARLVRFRLPESNEKSSKPGPGEFGNLVDVVPNMDLGSISPGGGQSLDSISNLIVH